MREMRCYVVRYRFYCPQSCLHGFVANQKPYKHLCILGMHGLASILGLSTLCRTNPKLIEVLAVLHS